MAEVKSFIPILKSYLKKMIDLGGSDLHIKSNSNIRSRIRGDMAIISKDIFPKSAVEMLAKEILKDDFEKFFTKKEYDYSFVLDENYRFRLNMFYQIDGISMVFRVIPTKILTIDELQLPNAIKKLTTVHRGLVLVTGVTGSGKSTTLASMINEINENYPKHIITIEDPVEFVHKDKKSLINQRSIGENSLSFANALKASLREDPDIILVGEMRDLETIEIALHAAETGHLVFSTLHTLDTKETINRIVSSFPPIEQNRIRITLASVIQGVISQRLVKTVDGKRAAALEILLKTPRIESLIAENRDSEITDALLEGHQTYGTQTFDLALYELFKSGRISLQEALANATSVDDLKLKVSILDTTKKDDDIDFELKEAK
ncbi:MAG: PilT/PilU family type 4a pilus ATPase [Campylobacterales bacterium]|nr:PilT/PilU family type 4a pilus ATPase [Campylobacterales bacterium]